MISNCKICGRKGWIISTRSDGARAVERCYSCQYYGDSDPRTKFDEDVAVKARRDGIRCQLQYPCLLEPVI
jgi:hypothetical protein